MKTISKFQLGFAVGLVGSFALIILGLIVYGLVNNTKETLIGLLICVFVLGLIWAVSILGEYAAQKEELEKEKNRNR